MIAKINVLFFFALITMWSQFSLAWPPPVVAGDEMLATSQNTESTDTIAAPVLCAEEALKSSHQEIRNGAIALCAGVSSLRAIVCAEEALRSDRLEIRSSAIKLCAGLN
jgi:hypothetical protein